MLEHFIITHCCSSSFKQIKKSRRKVTDRKWPWKFAVKACIHLAKKRNDSFTTAGKRIILFYSDRSQPRPHPPLQTKHGNNDCSLQSCMGSDAPCLVSRDLLPRSVLIFTQSHSKQSRPTSCLLYPSSCPPRPPRTAVRVLYYWVGSTLPQNNCHCRETPSRAECIIKQYDIVKLWPVAANFKEPVFLLCHEQLVRNVSCFVQLESIRVKYS